MSCTTSGLMVLTATRGPRAGLPPLRAVARGAVFPPHGSVLGNGDQSPRPRHNPLVFPPLCPGCAAQRNFCEGTWCQNGGTCVSRWNTYLCECPLRFGGKNCEQGEGLARGLGDLALGPSGSHGPARPELRPLVACVSHGVGPTGA